MVFGNKGKPRLDLIEGSPDFAKKPTDLMNSSEGIPTSKVSSHRLLARNACS